MGQADFRLAFQAKLSSGVAWGSTKTLAPPQLSCGRSRIGCEDCRQD